MSRAFKIAPSHNVSAGLAVSPAERDPTSFADPMMTICHSSMLLSSTRPALNPSTGFFCISARQLPCLATSHEVWTDP